MTKEVGIIDMEAILNAGECLEDDPKKKMLKALKGKGKDKVKDEDEDEEEEKV